MFPLWATFNGSTQLTWAGLTYEIHGAFYVAIASFAMGVAFSSPPESPGPQPDSHGFSSRGPPPSWQGASIVLAFDPAWARRARSLSLARTRWCAARTT